MKFLLIFILLYVFAGIAHIIRDFSLPYINRPYYVHHPNPLNIFLAFLLSPSFWWDSIKLTIRNKNRYAEIHRHTTELFCKSSELANAGKFDEAAPLAKSGKEYMQKHLGYFNINKQMLADFDVFFQEKCKSEEANIPQDLYNIIDEYISIVKPKLGEDAAKNLAMYIYLFHLDLFLTSWGSVLKSYRTKQ